MKFKFLVILTLLMVSCRTGWEEENNADNQSAEALETPYFNWKGATVYFLLTDRFNNGNTNNDITLNRTKETAKLRGFMGGDIKGITQKIEEGYFNDLGVNALWFTPVMEQIHDGTDEGTGYTYAYHGYWMKDWTAIDPNFGTKEDLMELIETAHKHGIRVLMDAVINHTGPASDIDPSWGDNWVREDPTCTYETYESIVHCTLVDNLPDILTEKNEAVELPEPLVAKWKAEGRYEQEIQELDAFFNETGYPRAPRFYIMKWLSDYVRELGIDGFRVDTARNTEINVWEEFRSVCNEAFVEWKSNNPDKVLGDTPFYMVGECYGYNIETGPNFNIGEVKVDYFNNSFDALINFDLKTTKEEPLEQVYQHYDSILHGSLKGHGTLSYMNSHDDIQSYDMGREKPYETAIRLLLAPGAAQIYYGDESARPLLIEGTTGDATLRSFMNWESIATDPETQTLLNYWQKLGQFRANHFSIGAGTHKKISDTPYTFSRYLKDGDYEDKVVVIIGAEEGQTEFIIDGVFDEGTQLRDAYSGNSTVVKNHKISIQPVNGILLLEEVR